jgi:DNA repair protein RadC
MQLSFSNMWAGKQQNSDQVSGLPVVREVCGTYRAATPEELMQAAAAQLGESLNRRLPMSKPQAAIDYIVARLATSNVEVFGAMFLDTQMRMIAFEEMFRGTLTQTSVYPREVVKAAVRNEAYAIVIAHNHPSGSSQPSQADIALTRRLKESVGLVDVRLVDHIIVAAGQGHSMAQRGLV